MKNLLLALIGILAFSLSSKASAPKDFAKHKNKVVKSHPPHYHYRVGSYHRYVPRHAVRIVRNGRVYFRYDGVFFSPYGRGWTVVNPPRVAPYRQAPRYRGHRPYHRYYRNGYRDDYRRGGNYGHGNRQGHRNGSGYNKGDRNGNGSCQGHGNGNNGGDRNGNPGRGGGHRGR